MTPTPAHPSQPAPATPSSASRAPAARPHVPEAAELLAALDPDQRAVAEHVTGPLCVLAGAGTGKTRAITYRIAHAVRLGAWDPRSVLAVTFTARAAGEMRSRLRDLGVGGVQARTFHSAALRQLGYFWPQAVGGALPRIAEHKASLVAEAAGRMGLGADRTAVRDLASEVEWAKVSLVVPEDYPSRAASEERGTPAGHDLATVARLLQVYEDCKTERGVIDFEDVLLLLIGIMVERADIAAQIREQYRRFVVDEYQDVSPLQQRLLDLWLGERTDLCVVGDVSQTIYSFTGATPKFLVDFPRRYPGAQVVRLVRDYRSTPQVVEVANQVLARAKYTEAAAVRLEAQRPSSVPVRWSVYDDDTAEAHGVARRVAALRAEGVGLSEIAVLFRTNNQSEAIENALSEAGIGYLVRGGERFFSRKEVRDAMVLLRGGARAAQDQGVGQAVRDILSTVGWTEQAPAARGAVRERWESLDSLVRLADELAETRGAGMREFVAELDERAQAQNAPTVEGVTLSSLHAAKGLEWDAVLMIGVSEGLLPISLADGDEAVAEERRLLYVGVTRAREHLELSWARSRTPGGRASRRRSRFLDGIWPGQPDGGGGPGGRGGRGDGPSRREAAKARTEAFYEDNPEDAPLFDDLREWRAGVAKERSKPAYTIMHDTTLRAIAQARPADVRELARLRGIGAAKIEAYGRDVLEIVARHSGRIIGRSS